MEVYWTNWRLLMCSCCGILWCCCTSDGSSREIIEVVQYAGGSWLLSQVFRKTVESWNWGGVQLLCAESLQILSLPCKLLEFTLAVSTGYICFCCQAARSCTSSTAGFITVCFDVGFTKYGRSWCRVIHRSCQRKILYCAVNKNSSMYASKK